MYHTIESIHSQGKIFRKINFTKIMELLIYYVKLTKMSYIFSFWQKRTESTKGCDITHFLQYLLSWRHTVIGLENTKYIALCIQTYMVTQQRNTGGHRPLHPLAISHMFSQQQPRRQDRTKGGDRSILYDRLPKEQNTLILNTA